VVKSYAARDSLYLAPFDLRGVLLVRGGFAWMLEARTERTSPRANLAQPDSCTRHVPYPIEDQNAEQNVRLVTQPYDPLKGSEISSP